MLRLRERRRERWWHYADRVELRDVEVAIVGAGFGGLGAAIKLDEAGIRDYVVLERAGDVGGTWWWNTYPGCQCDVPSNLYSFSFARKDDWTHSYPEQPQILDYLRDCAHRFGLMPRIRLRCEMLAAEWRQDEGRWWIETSDGSFGARFLIAATGLLSEPVIPDFPGLKRFRGTKFHSAMWDHDHTLRGERVAVIGTGATAIQMVPRIQPEVERLYVLQRTPPWVLPHSDREIGERLKRLYHVAPALQRLARTCVYWLRELLGAGFVALKPLMWITEAIARLHIRRQVPDPALRRKLTPGYRIGCKRILLSDDWYPTLQEPNVELVTAPIVEFREHSITFADGSERDVDTVIFATGFSPTDPPLGHRLTGREGRTLAETWSERMRAYLGTTVAGFPNLFLLWGPNTNLAHTSVVFMIESQLHYVLEALRAVRAQGIATLEPRSEVQDAWNDEIQESLARTVWNTGGCASWYLDASGDNPIMWPHLTFTFRRRLRCFELADYVVERPADERVVVGASSA
jgi:cation diffusion facilitator CzcD-associated flavoprotein CzcO